MQNTSISIGFVSLGCAKNLVDSEHMASVLLASGYELSASPEEADVVLVNTCAFIDAAKEEAIDTILEVCELKKTGSCRAVVVAGCLPQRYRDELNESLPEVDAFLGLDALNDVPAIVRDVLDSKEHIVMVPKESSVIFDPLPGKVLFSGGPFAYLKIAEGCNHRCGFCAVPLIRGDYRSRTQESVVEESRDLLGRGVKELNLISQDVMMYGADREGDEDLISLLGALDGLDGEFWVRILYGHPAKVSTELLAAMSGLPKVCNYLDIPIQHSHPEMLRAMHRPAKTRMGPVTGLPAAIREQAPDMIIRTTCLVGYPGETDEQFEHLLSFVKEGWFDHLGVFTFSPQEGTYAGELESTVPEELALERQEMLMLAQQDVVKAKSDRLMDTSDAVLLESAIDGEDNAWIGRARRQAPEIDGDTIVQGASESAVPGDFVEVTYSGTEGYDMVASAAE